MFPGFGILPPTKQVNHSQTAQPQVRGTNQLLPDSSTETEPRILPDRRTTTESNMLEKPMHNFRPGSISALRAT